MSAGDLKHLLGLRRPLRTPDGGGGFGTAWQELGEVYAHVAELPDGKQAIIRLRWRDDLATGMRLCRGEEIFRIESLRDPDGNREWLELRVVRE